jgi:hypothetical protein
MSQWTKAELEEVVGELDRKALMDAKLGKRVLDEADKVLEEVSGREVPSGLRFKVVHHAPEYHVPRVIPDQRSPREQFNERLDKVSDLLFPDDEGGSAT